MATKRMFSNNVIDTDAFLDMPLSAQALYFHLNMKADDDGFVANSKRIQRTVGASEDDLKLLIAKRFLITFDDGVLVIKHWRMHNVIRKDMYTPTNYQEDLEMLEEKPNKSYTLRPCNEFVTDSLQDRAIDKNRLDKNRLDNIYSPTEFGEYMNPPEVIDEVKPVDDIPYKDVIDYLNKVTGSNYRATTDKTKRLIRARFSENYTLDDFRKVIDKKVRAWKGTEYEKFLRPETLFGTKFEGYLNEKETRGKGNNFTPRANDYADLQAQLLEASMR